MSTRKTKHTPGVMLNPDGSAYACVVCGEPYAIADDATCRGRKGALPKPTMQSGKSESEALYVDANGFAEDDYDPPEGF